MKRQIFEAAIGLRRTTVRIMYHDRWQIFRSYEPHNPFAIDFTSPSLSTVKKRVRGYYTLPGDPPIRWQEVEDAS